MMAFLKKVLINLVFITILGQGTSYASCVDDLTSDGRGILEIQIYEHMKEGELLKNITTGQLKMDANHSLVTVSEGSVYLKVNMTVDGEDNKALCAELGQRTITLSCGEDNGQNTRLAVLDIRLTDDFAPDLPAKPQVHIRESTDTGKVVLDLTVDPYLNPDKDCETNTIRYNIISTENIFTISDEKVILAKELDYEQATEHNFELLVRTNVQNLIDYRNATTVVRVLVEDVDDTNPVFDVSKFMLNVQEEKNLTDQWLSTTPPIFARDGDTGINTTIGYAFVSVDPPLDLEIENDTGEVRIHSLLDRETTAVYEVIVRAYQLDNPLMTATTTLSVFVEDINDNRPVFTTSPTDVRVREDAQNGSYVIELTGEDKDIEANNSNFDFVIRSDGLGAFDVKPSTVPGRAWLIVKNRMALRGQTQGIVEIGLVEEKPSEGGPDCDYTTTCFGSITVNIDDANLHPPYFQNPHYSFNVYSNHDLSKEVGQLKADDKDKGDNAKVSYSLGNVSQSMDCSKLRVDADSGALTLTNQIPPDMDCLYIAKACDNPSDGSLRLCGTVALTLKVLPGNDNGNSSIDVMEYDITLQENIPIGSLVAKLNVQNVRTNSTDFRINKDLLVTNTELDREKQDLYTIAILSGTGMDSLTSIYRIHVNDVNDNSPEFTRRVYDIIIDDDVNTGDVVVQVNATDKDAGKNAVLIYKIESGSDWLAVDPSSGQVTLKKIPEKECLGGGEFSVSAIDSGMPPLQTLAILKVYAPSHNESAVVLLPIEKAALVEDVPKVERELSSILGVTVRIHHIDSLGDVEALGSKVFVSATNANGIEVSPSELDRLLKSHADAIHKAFAKEQDSDDDVFTIPFIVLLCLSIALLLLFIITLALLFRTRQKYKQNLRIFDKLNKDTSIYDSTRHASNGALSVRNNNNNPTILTPGYSNGSVSGIGSSKGSRTAPYENVLMGFDNPGYQHEDNQNSGRGQRNLANGDAQVENLALSQRSGPPNTEDLSSQTPESDQVTKFDSFMTEEVRTSDKPVHMTTINVKYPHNSNDGTNENNTPRWDRRNSVRSSEADSGIPNEKDDAFDKFRDDDDDTEVAQIMTGDESRGLKPSPDSSFTVKEEKGSTRGENPHLDLMKVKATLSTSASPPDDNDIDVQDGETDSDEPEPDYAKKVRFNETPVPKGEDMDAASKVAATEFPGEEMTKEVPRYEEEVDIPNTAIQDPSGSPNEFFLSKAEMTSL